MTDLTPAEREALERLRDVAPPAGAEARIRNALRARGEIRSGAGSMPRVAQIAAGVAIASALFTAGFFTGKGDRTMSTDTSPAQAPPTAKAPADERPRYVLLLHESPVIYEDGRTESQLVREYGDWARALGAKGDLVSGWKLTDDGRSVDPSSGTVQTTAFGMRPGQVGGLFIIRAADYDEAATIAATCPHVRYGGSLEVRAIDL
jgi:hypothetical protein